MTCPQPCNCKQTVTVDNEPPVENGSPITNSVIQTVHVHTDKLKDWLLMLTFAVTVFVSGYLFVKPATPATPQFVTTTPAVVSPHDQELANQLYHKTNVYVVREFAEGDSVKQRLIQECIKKINYDFTDYEVVSTNWSNPVIAVLVFTGERNEYGVEKAKYEYHGGTQLALSVTQTSTPYLPSPTNKNDIVITKVKWRALGVTDGDIIHIKYQVNNHTTNEVVGVELVVVLSDNNKVQLAKQIITDGSVNMESPIPSKTSKDGELAIPFSKALLVKDVSVNVNSVRFRQ
jgi:hypothetical protein